MAKAGIYAPRPFVGETFVPQTGRLSDLARQRGNAQADAHRRGGEISAQLWSGLGQQVAGSLREIAAMPEQARQRQMIEQRAAREEQTYQTQQQQQSAAAQRQAEIQAKSARLTEMLKANGGKPIAPDVLVAEFGLEDGSAMHKDFQELYPQAKAPEPFTLNPGDARFDGSGKQIASVPKPEPPSLREPNPTEASLALKAAAGDVEATKALALIRGQRPQPTPAGPRPLTQTAEQQLINRLTSQWTQATKPNKEINRQIQIMDAGLDAARSGNLAAGSEAVLQTFLKVLDPASVVREGEFWRLKEGQSLLNRMKTAVQRIGQGGWVPMAELENYAKLAKEVQSRLDTTSEPTRQRIQRNAERYGIPPELIFEGEQAALPADGSSGVPDLTGVKAGMGRKFTDGPFKGQTWSLGPDGKPFKVGG